MDIINHLKYFFDDNVMNEIKLFLIGNFDKYYNEEYTIKKNICYIEHCNIYDDTLEMLVKLVNNNIFIDKIILQTIFLNNGKLDILSNIDNSKYEEELDPNEEYKFSLLFDIYY